MPSEEEVMESVEGFTGRPRQLYKKHLHQKNKKPWFDLAVYEPSNKTIPIKVVFNSGNGMIEEPEVWCRKESNGDGDYWFEKE